MRLSVFGKYYWLTGPYRNQGNRPDMISSLVLFSYPQKIQPPPGLKSDPDRSPAIANMAPIALSVAVVDRLLGPRLVPVGVPVRLVPLRQQRIPLAIPPAQPLLSLILITAEP